MRCLSTTPAKLSDGKKSSIFSTVVDELKDETEKGLKRLSRNINQSMWFLDYKPPELLWIDGSEENILDKFWSVSDGDVGGNSKCTLERSEEGHLRFHGNLQLSINHQPEQKPGLLASFFNSPSPKLSKPGFAGFSSKPFVFEEDIDNYNVILLRIKTDGRKYYFNIQTESLPGDSVFRAQVQTTPGKWQTVKLLPHHFRLVSRGVACTSSPRMNWRCIRIVGMAISDGKEGPFDMSLESCSLIYDESVELVDDT